MITVPINNAPANPGTRVGMFSSYQREGSKTVLRFYGYGTYEGDFVVGDETGKKSYQTAPEKMKLFQECGKIVAPRLRHDDGTITWGVLVWWDLEDAINKYIEKADAVIHVSLSDKMTEFRAQLQNRREFSNTIKDINVYKPVSTGN